MSNFSTLMSYASDVITESHAERDQHGDFAKVVMHPPGGADPVELVGVIVGPLKQELQENSSGEVLSVETCWVDFTREQLGDLAIPLPERASLAISKYQGARFNVDDTASDYGGVFVRIGLKRAPMTAKGQKRESRNG